MNDSIAARIDHAVLQPTQAAVDVEQACSICVRFGVASICVKPSYVGLAVQRLAGTPVAVGTVIGFPHGGTSTAAKIAETRQACDDGAQEVDVVVNLGWVRQGAWDGVAVELHEIVAAAAAGEGEAPSN